MNLYAKICLAAFFSKPFMVLGETSIFAHIEAEAYTKSSGATKGCGGSCIENLNDGNYLGYRAIDFGPAGVTNAVKFRYSKSTAVEGRVEVRVGDPTGQLVGEFAPLGTGGNGIWKESSITLIDGLEGAQYVYFVGASRSGDEILSLDWFEFGNLEFAQDIWTVCGSLGECEEGNFAPAAISELHEVRCCSDTEKAGWTKNPGCGVWAEADLPTCYHAENFTSATKICSDNGARLCTKIELEAKCTKDSGCGHDRDLIWSSTALEDPDGHWLACGSSAGTCSGNEQFAFDNDLHEIRCCSDSPLSSGDESKCPDVGVYGYSELFNSECFHAETYGAAEMICKNFGGRLCTRLELYADCTKGTGCEHDNDLIWTSDTYGSGNLLSASEFVLDQLVEAGNDESFKSNNAYPFPF